MLHDAKAEFYNNLADESVFTLPQREEAVKSHVEGCRMAMQADFQRTLGPFKAYKSVQAAKDKLTAYAAMELENMLEENKIEWRKLISEPSKLTLRHMRSHVRECKALGYIERLSSPQCSKIKSVLLRRVPSIEKVARTELTSQILDAVKREKENAAAKAARESSKGGNKKGNKARLSDMSGSFLAAVVQEEVASNDYANVMSELHFLPQVVAGSLVLAALGFVLLSPVEGLLMGVFTAAITSTWLYL
jgi:hypothetical protein